MVIVIGTIARGDGASSLRQPSGSLLVLEREPASEAVSYQRRGLAMLKSRFGAEDIHTIDAMLELAGLQLRQQRYAEAESLYDRALSVLLHRQGVHHPQVAVILNRMVDLYLEQQNFAAADALAEFIRSIDAVNQRGD